MRGPTDIGRYTFEEVSDLDGPVVAEGVGLAGSSEGQLPSVVLDVFCNLKSSFCPVGIGNDDAAPVICKVAAEIGHKGEVK